MAWFEVRSALERARLPALCVLSAEAPLRMRFAHLRLQECVVCERTTDDDDDADDSHPSL